jgi:hypothetical protein
MAASRRRFNTELLLGISATFLSLAALIVSIVQTKIAREQQQASVWPHLEADFTKTSDEFQWAAINNGVGPAIVKSVEITYQGKVYTDASQLMKEQIDQTIQAYPKGRRLSLELYNGSITSGDVIKNDGQITLGKVAKSEQIANTLLEVIQDSSYHFRVTYSDIYNNCWLLDYTQGRSQVTQLSNCPN